MAEDKTVDVPIIEHTTILKRLESHKSRGAGLASCIMILVLRALDHIFRNGRQNVAYATGKRGVICEYNYGYNNANIAPYDSLGFGLAAILY